MSEQAKHPAVNIAVGAAVTALDGAAVIYRGAERVPVIGSWLHRSRVELSARGEKALASAIDIVLDELDLDQIVRRRIDLVGLANDIVDGIDLPVIIRQSTDSVTAEVMTDVRSQGERADDIVSGFVDRMLRREQGRE
ncbi:MAG: hypothetical protein WBO08_13820 [Mycobacterium sp.]